MNPTHTRIAPYLSDDHVHCDDLFAAAENAVAASDWETAARLYGQFRTATLLHFSREEAVLFPAFEAATGMCGGPTQVMRGEHAQMRDALAALDGVLDGRDGDGFLGLSETLLMLMRQHNLKEEQILYPMADRALAAQTADLLAGMAGLRE